MIFRPGRASVRRRLAVLVVHGSVGNYITGVPRRVSFGLANAGFTVMSVNTRMANYGVIFGGGLMHRTPLDLDAALTCCAAAASSASCCSASASAPRWSPTTRPCAGRPTWSASAPSPTRPRCRRRCGCAGTTTTPSPTYAEVADEAHLRLAPDYESPERDRIFVVRRARGFGDRPLDGEVWTYRTWWFSRGPRAPHAESRLRIGLGDGAARDHPGGRGRARARQRGPRARGRSRARATAPAWRARRSPAPTTSSPASTTS